MRCQPRLSNYLMISHFFLCLLRGIGCLRANSQTAKGDKPAVAHSACVAPSAAMAYVYPETVYVCASQTYFLFGLEGPQDRIGVGKRALTGRASELLPALRFGKSGPAPPRSFWGGLAHGSRGRAWGQSAGCSRAAAAPLGALHIRVAALVAPDDGADACGGEERGAQERGENRRDGAVGFVVHFADDEFLHDRTG